MCIIWRIAVLSDAANFVIQCFCLFPGSKKTQSDVVFNHSNFITVVVLIVAFFSFYRAKGRKEGKSSTKSSLPISSTLLT